MILPDNETNIDLLNNEAIASTIIQLLRDQPSHPVTIGVHGDWGAGKSSILKMIEAGLSGNQDVLCLSLNGWRFQGFEDAKIALIESIVTGLLEKRPAVTKATDAVKNVFDRIDWLKVAKYAGGLAFTAFSGIPIPNQMRAIVSMLPSTLVNLAILPSEEGTPNLVDNVKSPAKPRGESKKIAEEISAFREAFDGLLDKASIKQLVVLIDDLDRCLPETAIETLEAIRLFVFTKRTAFVIAADENMIEYAVRKHFPELPDTTGHRDYARNYLEKLIQVPFRIPALGETETRIYVTLLLVGVALGEKDEQYSALIECARNRLTRPWEGVALDAPSINNVLGNKASKVQDVLTLSNQIGPVLARGTQGNPRQIKRFLNSLLLRKRIADARGFGEAVKLPVLAKLMLAERFFPYEFDQLARAAATHPQGLCEDIAAAEATDEDWPQAGEIERDIEDTSIRSFASKFSNGRDDVSATTDEAQPAEWLAPEYIRAWARLLPPLAAVDLRPYLFVTKDRTDYFGAVSALGPLASIVDQLLGARLTVRTLISQLGQLPAQEAVRVFEVVQGRIMGSGTFDIEPAGIAGLEVLVEVHPTLQGNLLNFLENLPSNLCGPWPVTGWEACLKDPHMSARFDCLLGKWSKSDKSNPLLKTAASATLKTRRQKR